MDRRVEKVSKISNRSGDHKENVARQNDKKTKDDTFKNMLHDEEDKLRKKEELKDMRRTLIEQYDEITRLGKRIR